MIQLFTDDRASADTRFAGMEAIMSEYAIGYAK